MLQRELGMLWARLAGELVELLDLSRVSSYPIRVEDGIGDVVEVES
jgi:hypothetical protein